MKRAIWAGLLLALVLQGCGGGSTPSDDPVLIDDGAAEDDVNTSQGADETQEDEGVSEEPADDDTSQEEDGTASGDDGEAGADQNDTASETGTVPPAEPIEDRYFSQQWNLDYDASFYAANTIDDDAHIHPGDVLQRYGGRGVTIAVIDDGLDVYHEDFDGALAAAFDSETKTDDVSHRSGDTGFHGTAVSGIVAARANGLGIRGVASEARVVFLRHKSVMGDSDWIELFGKAQDLGADVINCSWGTYDVSPAVKSTIQDLARNGRDGKGIPIVFAAGNDDRSMDNDESAIPEVIAVGATGKDNLRADYSNFGPELDVMAPGGENGVIGIATFDPTGGDGETDGDYFMASRGNIFHGTSAATPIVTGVIAILLEIDPELTREEIARILVQSSDKIDCGTYDAEGHSDYCGYGKINLSQAVSMLLGE